MMEEAKSETKNIKGLHPSTRAAENSISIHYNKNWNDKGININKL